VREFVIASLATNQSPPCRDTHAPRRDLAVLLEREPAEAVDQAHDRMAAFPDPEHVGEGTDAYSRGR
jgi:hypothetical protein